MTKNDADTSTTEICPKIENCSKIFVSYALAIGIVISFVIVIVTAAWATSSKITNVDNTLENYGTRITNVEIATSKIDTVILMLRNIQRDK